MALRLELAGVVETRERLRALIDELDDMSPLWGMYAEIMAATEAAWFSSEGEGSWPPLAASTIREKARLGYTADPLIRTGDLLASLTNPAVAMEIGQGRSTLGTFTRNAMTWGTSVEDERGREYAHYHQHTDPNTGEPRPDYGVHPPERQVIPWPLPPQTRAQFESANETFIAEAIKRSER